MRIIYVFRYSEAFALVVAHGYRAAAMTAAGESVTQPGVSESMRQYSGGGSRFSRSGPRWERGRKLQCSAPKACGGGEGGEGGGGPTAAGEVDNAARQVGVRGAVGETVAAAAASAAATTSSGAAAAAGVWGFLRVTQQQVAAAVAAAVAAVAACL